MVEVGMTAAGGFCEGMMTLSADLLAEPDSFLCPISKHIMTDPVAICDGHTFDRASIAEWFRRGNRKSPLTNLPLPTLQLLPNVALKKAISEYLIARPELRRRAMEQDDYAKAVQCFEEAVVEKGLEQLSLQRKARQLESREAELQSLEAELLSREAQLASREAQLASREAEVAAKEAVFDLKQCQRSVLHAHEQRQLHGMQESSCDEGISISLLEKLTQRQSSRMAPDASGRSSGSFIAGILSSAQRQLTSGLQGGSCQHRLEYMLTKRGKKDVSIHYVKTADLSALSSL